ncbi:cation efflux family-domain-containing protein [Myxozyma melibiosi]|uniref:Cation efflux family-domain-containing protein n=1 Tax=Myxozyma melibiosi TaxID=54550 RepID=A0ABR1FBY3_9ASCO
MLRYHCRASLRSGPQARLLLSISKPSLVRCSQPLLVRTHTHSPHHNHDDDSHSHAHSHSASSSHSPPSSSTPKPADSPVDHNHSHSLFHSHTHSHDPSLLISTDPTDPAVKITRVGLFVNIGMAVVKGTGGYLFNSKSLMADAVHALSDLLSDFLTLATVRVALRKPTHAFPNGFGKVEALGSLGVSAMLVIAGLGIGVNGVETLYSHAFEVESLADAAATVAADAHNHPEGILHSLFSHSHSHGPPDVNAAWLAAGSIVIKEWLFQATMKVAKEKQSTVLAANAWHHRVDCLTSIVAILAITGSHFLHLDWLDPVGGVLVSGAILQAGLISGRQALLELADHGLPEEKLDQIKQAAERVASAASFTSESPVTVQVLDVRGTKSGPVLSSTVDVRISGANGASVSLIEANRIAKDIKAAVAQDVMGIRSVVVRTFDEHEQDVSSWIDIDKKL